MNIVCKICNKKFKTERGLSYHITHSHKITLEHYYLNYECKDVEHAGKCQVCGNPTPFISRLEGYQKTCSFKCGGIFGSKQGKETTLKKYGKKSLNNPDKNKQFYQEHPEIKLEAYKKAVATRKKNNSYTTGGMKARTSYLNRLEEFLTKNDCRLIYDLVREFGEGWYKNRANILDDSDYIFLDNPTNTLKASSYFIKNSAISKIEKYCQENNFNQSSHGEKEIVSFIKSICTLEVIENTKKLITPYELDVYIPEKKVAIEYNGTYWHSFQLGTPKNYHFMKSKMCEDLGIRLIHVYEYQWQDPIKREILKSIIKNAIGINDNKIYARKCEIKELSKVDVENFSIRNSLHGHRNASVYLGLFYNNELVELMSFGKAFFSKDDSIDYECIRSITKLNTTVVGGMNKLFKYFIKKYNPNKILYYVDYNTHNGNSMSKLNFEFKSYSKHGIINIVNNYYSADNINLIQKYGEVFNRKPFLNKEIKELTSQGRILTLHDAGVKKYIWTNKNSE